MKSRFKILALFIFLLMLGSWYFTSDVDVMPKTYPDIKFQTKEGNNVLNKTSGKNSNALVSNSWNMSGVYSLSAKGRQNKGTVAANVASNRLERTHLNYVASVPFDNVSTRRTISISGVDNVKYGRTSSVRNGTLAYASNPISYNRLNVGYKTVDLINSDVIMTGLRFGASAPCKPGFTHTLGPDGRCIHCGATLSAAGDGTGEIEWVPIPDAVPPLLFICLIYISIFIIKRK